MFTLLIFVCVYYMLVYFASDKVSIKEFYYYYYYYYYYYVFSSFQCSAFIIQKSTKLCRLYCTVVWEHLVFRL